jgi:hypothetical protein
MEAMLTYGPDVNVSLPESVARGLDLKDLHQKINYYVPALTALTLGSPSAVVGLGEFGDALASPSVRIIGVPQRPQLRFTRMRDCGSN